MNNSQYGHNQVPVASLVKSGKPKVTTGCWIGLFLGGFVLVCFCLLAGAIYYVVAPLSTSPTQTQFAFTPEALQAELSEDFQYAKDSFDNASDPTTHPQYQRIEQFVSSMTSVLDDTPNQRLQRVIDYDRHFEEICRHTDEIYNNRLTRNIYVSESRDVLVGPNEFSELELIQIDNIGTNEFRVVLSYSTGFGSKDPHVWWLIDDQGKLKLYDWQELDYGFRDSAETGIYISSSLSESFLYDKYCENMRAYHSTYNSDLSYAENQRISLELLAKCELYQGPSQLGPGSQLNVAAFWNYAGEQRRAIKMLDSISLSNISPGIHRLTGDIYFSQGRFEKALASYQEYVSVLGHTPYVLDQLAACFMNLGDEASEREMRKRRLHRLNANSVDNLAHLMEINNRSQNTALFSQIDSADDRDEIYSGLIVWFNDSEYFADQFEQLSRHLAQTMTDSEALIQAKLKSANSVAGYLKVLERIESYSGEDADRLRSQFWYEIPEDQVVEIFKSAANKTANMKAISTNQDHDYIFDDDRMIEICELAIENDSENFYALYQLGSAEADRKKNAIAIKHLKQALLLIPEESGFESSIRSSLMQCYYQSGDRKAAIELAKEHDMATQFFYLINSNSDFSNFGSLLNQLTLSKNEREYQTALWEAHQGNTDDAILQFAQILSNQDEPDYGYHQYECETKLIELGKKTGDVAQLIRLVPNDNFLQRLITELVEESDWSLCQQLLLSSDPNFAVNRFKLASMIAWEKGDYKKIIADADKIISMAAKKDMKLELERLVRSALRTGNLNHAETLAIRAERVGLSPAISTLVAMRQNRLDELLETLFELEDYERSELLFDKDIKRSDLIQLAKIEEPLSWRLPYGTTHEAALSVRLLLNDETTIDQDFIQQTLSGVFDGEPKITIISIPESKTKTWRFEFPDWQIYTTFGPIPAQLFDDEYLSDNFKAAAERVSNDLKITGFAQTTKSNFEYKSTISAVVEAFLDTEFLLAADDNNRWLSKDQIKEHFAQAKSDSNLLPFGTGLYEYLEDSGDTDELSDERSTEFDQSLATAIKRFLDSSDPKKRLSISLETTYDFESPVVADIKRIKRTSYGGIEVVAIVQPNDKSLIPGGITIEVPTWNIHKFDLQADNTTISKTR